MIRSRAAIWPRTAGILLGAASVAVLIAGCTAPAHQSAAPTLAVTTSSPAPTTPTPTAASESAKDALTASSADLTGLAVSVLSTQLGYTPSVTCPPKDVEIVEGSQLVCTATLDLGLVATALVTLTNVAADRYEITVVLS